MLFAKKGSAPSGADRLLSDSAERVIGCRYAVTGAFGYDFYQNDQKVCAVTGLVVPSFPVRISGCGQEWESAFDAASTLFPGLTRHVYACRDHSLVASIVYKDRGDYEINGTLRVRCGAGYTFFQGQKEMARILPGAEKAAECVPASDALETGPYLEVLLRRELSDTLKLLVLAFPMLEFGR